MAAQVVGLPAAAAPQEELRAWARAYGVRWEIARHFEMVGDRKTQVGFDLTLIAARPAGCDGDPGCTECARTHEGMARLAMGVLPPGTQHAVEPFDGSFHLGDEAEPELLLTVEIFPEGAEPEAADRAVLHTLGRVEAALRRLGIPQHSRGSGASIDSR